MPSKVEISVIFANFATWFIIGVFAAYLPLYAYYILGASNVLVGLLATIYFAVNAPSSILFGYLIDKYHKTKIILVFSLMLIILSTVLIIYVNDPYQLLILRLIQGIAVASIIPISNLLGSEFFGPGRGVGLINMFGSLGFLLSTLIGGFILNYVTYINLFLYSSIIPLISFIILLGAPAYIIKNDTDSRGIKLSDIKKISKPIWIMYIALFLRHVGAAGVWSLFSLFIFSIGGDNILLGILFAINPLIQTIIFEKFGKYSEGRGITIFQFGLLLSAIVFIGYYISPNPYFIIIFQVVLGFSWVSIYTGINVYIIENVPTEIRGTSLGLVNTILALGWILGSFFSGYVADFTGSYKTYIFLSFISSLSAFILVRLLYKYS